MSYNVFKELVFDVDRIATCSEYKNIVKSLIEQNLYGIEEVYKIQGTVTTAVYNTMLDEMRRDLNKAQVYMETDDAWKFDYVSFERHIIGVFKRVLWARMDYEDVKKIRDAHKMVV